MKYYWLCDNEEIKEMKGEISSRHNLLRVKWNGKDFILKEFIFQSSFENFRKEVELLSLNESSKYCKY